MITKHKIPLLITSIFLLEVLIYLWAVWTSTFNETNFFAIHPEFIFDKCARLAGRVSSVLILIALFLVGYYGLKKIYADEKKKDSFFILITLFTCNHLIHLLFVILRFRSHGDSITFSGPIDIGGTVHGVLTFSSIVVMPYVLWKYKSMNKLLYVFTVFYLLNISSFIVKTFLGKIQPPDHPAYHNQLGVVVLTAACLYVLYRVYMENKRVSL